MVGSILTNSEGTATKVPELVLNCRDIVVEYELHNIKVSTLKELVVRKLRRQLGTSVTRALDTVTLQAYEGECIALIGHNGCGKSTFLKVMAGIIEPTHGSVWTKGRVAPLIELGAGFDPELSGRENVFLACSLMGLTRKEIQERLPEIEEFAELGKFFDSPVKTYSSGMYMRLGFSCSVVIEAELMLIDEILAVGDENYQRKCISKMHLTRNSGATIILVSHDLNVVKAMADRVLVIDNGKVVFEGQPLTAVDSYLHLMEQKRLEKLPKVVRDEEFRMKKLVDHSGEKAAKGLARFTDIKMRGHTESPKLTSGCPWSIELDVDIRMPLEHEVVVGFGILTKNHQRLTGGSTKTLGRSDPIAQGLLRSKGKATVRFEFDSMPLASGEYHLVVAIHDYKVEQEIELIVDAVIFEVCCPNDPHNFDRDLLSLTAFAPNVKVEAYSKESKGKIV